MKAAIDFAWGLNEIPAGKSQSFNRNIRKIH